MAYVNCCISENPVVHCITLGITHISEKVHFRYNKKVCKGFSFILYMYLVIFWFNNILIAQCSFHQPIVAAGRVSS